MTVTLAFTIGVIIWLIAVVVWLLGWFITQESNMFKWTSMGRAFYLAAVILVLLLFFSGAWR